jgi:pimeloyl-ACP methyl ester carboxylesterase
MNRTAVGMLALCLAACGGPAPAPEAEVAATDAFADQWFDFRATDEFTPEGVPTKLNLHKTAGGLSGYLGKARDAYWPIRNVQLTDKTLSFTFLANGATFHADLVEPGKWRGKFDVSGALSIDAVALDAPPERIDFAVLPDGRRMHIVCSGEGSPVVLLDYGAGGTMKRDWGDLAMLAAEKAQTKVCAYDRAGRGLSDPAATPRDAAAVADDIDAMLTAANLPPPYILVGHSMGSYHIRQYANTRADRTAGLVLVDPSGDGQLARFNAVIPKVQQMQDEMFKAQAELQCITRLREKPVAPDDPFAQQCGGNDPEALLATKSEIDSMPGASTEQLTQSRRAYGAMPVIVLTRGDYEKDMPPNFTAEDRAAMKTVWETLHAEMAALSTAGEQRHIPGAGHYIQRDNPEAVLTAIADVVAKARQAP